MRDFDQRPVRQPLLPIPDSDFELMQAARCWGHSLMPGSTLMDCGFENFKGPKAQFSALAHSNHQLLHLPVHHISSIDQISRSARNLVLIPELSQRLPYVSEGSMAVMYVEQASYQPFNSLPPATIAPVCPLSM